MRPVLRALVGGIALTIATATGDADASSALELVRVARAAEQARQEDVAVRRYMEALSLDPVCEEAYLGLGSLRTRRGDLREAERVYSVALEHLPQLRPARLARAYVRRALGFQGEAIQDLLAGLEEDIATLKTLASWYGEDGQTPAQLAVWRRILGRAETLQDPALAHEARTMVRALIIVVGTADPAASPPENHGIRRTVSVLARRGQ
jgi:tetratricopeptide (TPR) repeat protein